MITLAWYLLKVIICSGILCGYYFLALRNKAFHRWNRFYLLAAIVLALVVPIVKINIFKMGEDKGTVAQVLQTISYGDEAIIEYSHNSGFQLNTENMAEAAYLLISAVFLFIFLFSIYKIKRLRKKYPETRIQDISFINTSEKGTPFSFFKSIFWNQAIDLHSRPGQQIFNHEIAHVKEKHSYDKMFMNIVLIFLWINPFFWLMRKELHMIHEFIADKEALEDSDIGSFAEMILQTVYPGQHFSSTNPFFYSPIKRRILMLTKNKNPKVSYISRLLVLPLAAIVFFAFTFKVKNSTNNLYHGKTITVVVDAGHGGADNGAVSAGGLKEKDITLSIAKNIAAFNSNEHIKILLSRDNDETIPVNDRVAYAEKNKADLFISIHVNSSTDKQLNGFSVLIDKQNSEQNLALGSSLINALKETYKTEDKIGVRKNGIFILDKNICPASLIECGFLSNTTDANFVSNSANRKKIAKNILDAINDYALSNVSDNTTTIDNNKMISAGIINTNDTIPSMHVLPPPPGLPSSEFKSNALFVIDGNISTNEKANKVDPKSIESINVLKGEEAIKKYGGKGKNGVIEIITKYKMGNVSFVTTDAKTVDGFPGDALVFVDGKEVSTEEFKNINPGNIESITILKDTSAVKIYGNKAKNGVIQINTKSKTNFSGSADTVYFHSPAGKPSADNAAATGNVVIVNSKIPDRTLIFADGKEISKNDMKNIPPDNIQSVNVLKGETAIKKYGEKAKEGAVEITTKHNIPPNTLIIIDGKESTADELKNMPPANIESITVLKDEAAEKKYGTKEKNGVLEITSKIGKGFAAAADTIYFRSDSSLKPISVNGKFKGDITFIKSKIPQSTLIFADGKEISTNEMKSIAPINIQSINVLKGESAIEKYGEKGKDGVIEITIKSKS